MQVAARAILFRTPWHGRRLIFRRMPPPASRPPLTSALHPVALLLVAWDITSVKTRHVGAAAGNLAAKFTSAIYLGALLGKILKKHSYLPETSFMLT